MNVILVVITILLTTIIFAWFGKLISKEKKTKSIQKFAVCYSPGIRKALFYLSFVFVLLGLIIVVASGFERSGFEIFVFMVSMSVLVWIFVLAIFFWRLDVDKDNLRYRNFMGKTTEIHFNQIDKIVLTDQKSLVIYANGKKMGTLNRDFLHLDNFRSYCEARGLAIQSETGKTLTKLRLYMGAMKLFFGMAIAFSIFLGVIVLFVGIINNNLLIGLLSVAISTVFFFLLFIIIGSVVILPQINRITTQESFYQIKFRDEMQTHNISAIDYISPDWFINANQTRILVFRRGFISKIEQVNIANNSAKSFALQVAVMIAIGENGKKMKIVGELDSIQKLKKWVEEDIQ